MREVDGHFVCPEGVNVSREHNMSCDMQKSRRSCLQQLRRERRYCQAITDGADHTHTVHNCVTACIWTLRMGSFPADSCRFCSPDSPAEGTLPCTVLDMDR